MKSEKRIAKKFKGKVTRASGALPQDKGDVRVNQLKLILQVKETSKDSFRVNTKLLDKCLEDARSRNPEFFGGLLVTFSKFGELFKDQFVIYDLWLKALQLVYQDIQKRAVKVKKLLIKPSSGIYWFKDDKRRKWYIVPANYYKWV